MPALTLATAVGVTTWRLATNPTPRTTTLSSSQPSSSVISSGSLVVARSSSSSNSMGEQPKTTTTTVASNTMASATNMSLTNIYEFICQGPLLHRIGLDRQQVMDNVDEWIALGLRLSRILGFQELFLTESEKARIYHYYLPVFMWCKKELETHRSGFKDGQAPPALVIGISAPQGCGKTTLVDALEYLFNSTGRAAASVSIDDFYLTAKDQAKLAASEEGNNLLELRGNAGSHDLELGTESIQTLRNLREGDVEAVPHYDKSANNGRGDRADPATWTKVAGPLQVLLFEGWMLGFQPIDKKDVVQIDPQLEVVNKNLEAYQDAWFGLVDSWIIVQVQDPEWVFQWRLEAEIAMKAQGKPGMSDAEVADFVDRYMPAYKAYLPALYSQGPRNARSGHILKFHIDKQRNPLPA